ncbi:hypothetical protein [Xenorhabdus sp. IM139775]|uniref:hypothetical protein n=1 Tax=Xenorhabdus sp. IM139775 TaxID=3025876 RepID=UPI002358A163|nr:hypothetical protein [Xenorhabdus sp. IM139775]MDC9593137.1 hypothetical protein [Xenorhabdus sp. IM139775]
MTLKFVHKGSLPMYSQLIGINLWGEYFPLPKLIYSPTLCWDRLNARVTNRHRMNMNQNCFMPSCPSNDHLSELTQNVIWNLGQLTDSG